MSRYVNADMAPPLTRTALALLILGFCRPAIAGPGDTPLPTFADGKPAQAVYLALGVMKNNNLETDVVCTSLEATPVDIGFQTFDETGALRNNVSAPGPLCNAGTRSGLACTVDSSLDTVNGCPGATCPGCCGPGSGAMLAVAPGKTVTIGTAGTAQLHEDATMAFNTAGNGLPQLRNGSGRIVATSPNVFCTAVVADKLHTICDPAAPCTLPPPTIVTIPLVRIP
jgi:hypothetical protein